jgi:hypothetical protein
VLVVYNTRHKKSRFVIIFCLIINSLYQSRRYCFLSRRHVSQKASADLRNIDAIWKWFREKLIFCLVANVHEAMKRGVSRYGVASGEIFDQLLQF